MTEVDITHRLEQWKQEATDPKNPNYGDASLDEPVGMYATISGLLNKLRTAPESFGREDVVTLFGTMNSGRRMKNRVAKENSLLQLREHLLTLLDGEGAPSAKIDAAAQAIKYAGRRMIGELYGWAHADTAPLYNDCATDALAYLGYEFEANDYDAFCAAHEQFKQVYQQHVGPLRLDLPLNLEIDKLYNVIQKVDIPMSDNGPDKALGKPFDEMFRDWEEAEWAFKFMADAIERLGIDDPEDPRVSYNLRKVDGEYQLRLIYGSWLVLAIGGKAKGLTRAILALPMDRMKEPPRDQDRFSVRDGERPFALYWLDVASVKPLEGQLRQSYEESVDYIRERFAHWTRSNFHPFNKPAIAQAVFDPVACQRLLSKGTQASVQRYWKIAPGGNAWNWDACREGGFIAIGWEKFGDISALSRKEFDALRDKLVATYSDWTKAGANQVWTFAQIQEGDRIVANRGTTEVVGIGTVIGPYYFVPDVEHGHRFPVRWDDTEPRPVSKPGWQRTILELEEGEFNELLGPTVGGGEMPPAGELPFTVTSFELLEGIRANPTKEFYQSHKDGFKTHVEEPFRQILRQVAEQLPPEIKSFMETENQLFGRFLKNDWGRGGAWDFYWGAFYPKGGRRTEDAQLSLWMNYELLEYGFYIGAYGGEQRKRFQRNCQKHGELLLPYLREALPEDLVTFGSHDNFTITEDGRTLAKVKYTWEGFLRDPASADNDVSVLVPRQELLVMSEKALVERIVETYAKLFPLVLLAVEADPMPAIARYQESVGFLEGESESDLDTYDRSAFLAHTHLKETEADELWELLHDKRQIILFGPPGTGKSFVAQKLAKWITGLAKPPAYQVEMIQFHPAYSYEDFIEGIRPESKPTDDNHFVVDYPARAGVFRRFCEGAASDETRRCVFIIDEINRGNIPRIFGELMLLLEYRDRDVPLPYSGKRFRIPPNVYLIGTMNTADRSIALVDFALRRRFHFFHFGADPDLLERWLIDYPVGIPYLARLYRRLSEEAIDDPDYAIGPSYFMDTELTEQKLKRIWRRSIIPYLAEYFIEQPARLSRWQWDSDFLKGIRGEA